MGPSGTDGAPSFRLVDTPGNRACFDQLHGLVCDPDKPEQVLKVDADASGQGGDDMADETFYALASRPYAATVVEDRREPADLQELAWATARGDLPVESARDDYDVTNYGD
jgi:hypothetical protein